VGSFVAPDAIERIKAEGQVQLDTLASALRDLALAHVDIEAVQNLVEEVWKDASQTNKSNTSQRGGEQR